MFKVKRPFNLVKVGQGFEFNGTSYTKIKPKGKVCCGKKANNAETLDGRKQIHVPVKGEVKVIVEKLENKKNRFYALPIGECFRLLTDKEGVVLKKIGNKPYKFKVMDEEGREEVIKPMTPILHLPMETAEKIFVEPEDETEVSGEQSTATLLAKVLDEQSTATLLAEVSDPTGVDN